VGPRAVLNAMMKRKIPSPRRESNPRTPITQPVAQCYSEYHGYQLMIIETINEALTGDVSLVS